MIVQIVHYKFLPNEEQRSLHSAGHMLLEALVGS